MLERMSAVSENILTKLAKAFQTLILGSTLFRYLGEGLTGQ